MMIDSVAKNLYVLAAIFALIVTGGIVVEHADELYHSKNPKITMFIDGPFVSGTELNVNVLMEHYDGRAIDGETAEIYLVIGDNVVESTRGTVKNGVLSSNIRLPKYSSGYASVVVKYKNTEVEKMFYVMESTKYSNITSGEKISGLVMTDKPIYQPGQTMHIRALVFKDNRPYVGNTTIEVVSPQGEVLYRNSIYTNEFGVAWDNFTFMEIYPEGRYHVNLYIGHIKRDTTVDLRYYVLPKFKITFVGVNSWYSVDKAIDGVIRAEYIFGRPIQGTVTIEAFTYYGIWEKYHVLEDESLDSNGEYEFHIPAVKYAVGVPINNDLGYIMLNATVVDTTGHSETKSMMITVTQSPLTISIIPDTNVPGLESEYMAIIQSPDGKPIENASVSIYLDDIYYGTYKTDTLGIAKFSFIYKNQYYLKINASANGNTATRTYILGVNPGLKVVPERYHYKIGDNALIRIYYTGESYTKWIYYDIVSEGQTVTTGVTKLNDKGYATVEFTVTTAMVPEAMFRVYHVEKDSNVRKDYITLAIEPGPTLNVTIDIDKKIKSPGENVSIGISVMDNDDNPRVAAVGLCGVDTAIYEMSERFGGFEEIYFTLEDERMTPTYQVISYIEKGDINYMPTLATKPIVDLRYYQSGVYYPNIAIKSTYGIYEREARKFATSMSDAYWSLVIAIGSLTFLMYIYRYARKKSHTANLSIYRIPRQPDDTQIIGAVIAVIMMVALTVVLAGVLYMWTMSMSNPSGSISSDWGSDTTRDDRTVDEAQPVVPKKEESPKGSPTPSGGFAVSLEGEEEGEGVTEFSEGGLMGQAEDETEESIPEVRVRYYFPETWYWNPMILTDDNGFAKVTLRLPDSITTWELSAIASDKEANIGNARANITVMKTFFVEPDIPVFAIRNESFPLRVMVFNYGDSAVNATVYLTKSDWFDLMDTNKKKIHLESNSTGSVYFNITAKRVGTHKLCVRGYNGVTWDAVERNFTVKPDGKEFIQEYSGNLNDDDDTLVNITINPIRIENSETLWLKLQGGIDAVLIDGADKYIHFVHGCGEQSTSLLSVNIAAYKALLRNPKTTPEQLFDAEVKITQGINHISQYIIDVPEVQNGKATQWFYGQPPDLWLTAWGIFAFKDLADAGFDIDEDIIPGMQAYLASQQSDDGSYIFPEVGHWSINSELKNVRVAATAYIARALLYSGYPKDSDTIEKCVGYIVSHVSTKDTVLTKALALWVLAEVGVHSDIASILADSIAMEAKYVDDGGVYWTWATDTYRYGYNENSIETTSYAIIALYRHGKYTNLVTGGITYLLTNRRGGCWGSTHATAVSFQAIEACGTLRMESVYIDVYCNGDYITTQHFNKSNKDITYYFDLKDYISTGNVSIKIVSRGTGIVLWQVHYSEYIPWNKTQRDQVDAITLNIIYNTTNISVGDCIEVTVTVGYNIKGSMIKMLLVELHAPMGFSFVTEDFDALVENGIISFYELGDREASVYLSDLVGGQTITFSYGLKANMPISSGLIQGQKAYNMYDHEMSTEAEPVVVSAIA